jgi:hypothetical protein
VALRPRLSPGVPLSRCRATLECGTKGVKRVQQRETDLFLQLGATPPSDWSQTGPRTGTDAVEHGLSVPCTSGWNRAQPT